MVLHLSGLPTILKKDLQTESTDTYKQWSNLKIESQWKTGSLFPMVRCLSENRKLKLKLCSKDYALLISFSLLLSLSPKTVLRCKVNISLMSGQYRLFSVKQKDRQDKKEFSFGDKNKKKNDKLRIRPRNPLQDLSIYSSDKIKRFIF